MAGWRLSYLDWKAKRKLSEDLKQPPAFATTGAPQGKRALKGHTAQRARNCGAHRHQLAAV
jgi:hypothetical protein